MTLKQALETFDKDTILTDGGHDRTVENILDNIAEHESSAEFDPDQPRGDFSVGATGDGRACIYLMVDGYQQEPPVFTVTA